MGQRIEDGFLTVMRAVGEWGDGVHWYVRLDGSDEPPVIAYDRRWFGVWHAVSPSFSEYVFALIWDKQLDTRYRLSSIDKIDTEPLGEETRQFLYSHFTPLNARCDDIGKQTLRFEREDQHIRIEITLDSPDECDWQLHAASPTSLYALVKTLWHYDNLDTRLRAGRRFDSKAVLDRQKGQWEYQLSCSYEYKDKPFNQQDRDYLKAHLPREHGWRWRDGAVDEVSEAYGFEDTGKQVCVAILRPQDVLSWRLQAESLNQLASLCQYLRQLCGGFIKLTSANAAQGGELAVEASH